MATYLILNLLVMMVLTVVLILTKQLTMSRTILITVIVVCLVTIIGDSLIIGAGIVDYDPNLILGAKLWLAPIEDFAYAIVAAILVPSLWLNYNREVNNGND